MIVKKKLLSTMLVVIMAISAVAVIPVSGKDTVNQGESGYVDCGAPDTYKVLRGETLEFSISGLAIIGKSEDVEGLLRGSTSADYDTEAEFSARDCGYLWFVDVDGNTDYTAGDLVLSLEEPRLDIKIQDTEGNDIESTTIETPIRVHLSTNLEDDDVVKIKTEDPDGYVTDIAEVEVSAAKNYEIDTTYWDTGDYEIWVETVKKEARGLDIESKKDKIEMYEAEITIEAEEEEPMEFEFVKFTVIAPPNAEFEFDTTKSEYVMMTDKEDNPLDLKTSDESMSNYGGKFTATTDKGGKCEFVMYFTEDKSFTLTVEADLDGDGKIGAGEDADIDIDVQEAEVEFEIARTAVIGEEVEIKGTVSSGKYVVIAFDDIVEFKHARVTNGKFEEEWDTSKERKGSVTIDVFIEPKKDGKEIWEKLEEGKTNMDKDYPSIKPDGSTSIRLVKPGITIEQPRDRIAKEDHYVIKGVATGVNNVDIIIVGPDGYIGGGTDDIETGLLITTGSVRENEFEEEIDISKDTDAGKYTAIVLAPGRINTYGRSDYKAGDIADLLEDPGQTGYSSIDDYEGMDADQIIDILMDVTVEARGSDDLYDALEFRVDEPYVRFDVPIKSVAVGDDLIVTGTTNREDGTLITITTTEGPTDLTGFAEVEEGKFTVTIDTTDAKEGKYLLKAEDPDDNIDEGSVTLGAGVVTISVKDVNVEPDEVLAGENVTITITVENTGGIMGTYTPDVTVNGETIEVKEVTIFAGEEKEIVIEYTTPSMGGKYTVTADGEEDKFEVVGAEFEITELTVTESVKPDENVMITAVITNVGTIEGTKTIVAKMNDTEIGSEAVTLAPNATETVTFITTAPSEEGEYTITVDGETATFTVKTPGFEAVFAIVGLLAVAYLVNRRRKK